MHLGDYIWDELLVFLAEMCKELEIVELNSRLITDSGLAHLLKRAEHLSALDVSACPEFTGRCFWDIEDQDYKATGLKWLKTHL